MSNSLNKFLEDLYQALRSDKLVLPTLPEMALKVRDVVSDENSSLADVAKVINRDPALAARLIQLANSPLLKSRVPIESVDMAVMRMGASMVKNIVTAMVMEQLFQATHEVTDRKLRQCWKHASEVSSIAVGIALQYPHYAPDQAMLAGLVHDIGILPILTMAEDYPDLLKDEARLDDLIQRAHPFVGQAILKHWGFPEALVSVPREHENLMYDSHGKPDYVDLIIVAKMQSERNHGRLPKNLKTIPAYCKLGLEDNFETIDMDLMSA
jgi:HD-like signal output (HDOD) protein